jgi:3-hydroxyisobutyrate dehydrogenase
METIALLGTGTMGAGMAGRLLGAGYPLTVWNRNAERAASLVERGARRATSPRDAAKDADVVIAMVADDEASRAVWLGESGALTAARPGAMVIESSTLTPAWISELAAKAAAQGCEFLDAPVTGSRAQAESGELRFLVGGEESTLDRARDVLGVMGRAIVHVGPTGSGALLKLINNFLAAAQSASFAEAIALMEKSGLNLDLALPVLLEGAPGSPMLRILSQRILTRDATVHFSVALMRKDLGYAMDVGDRYGVPLEMAATTRGSFQRAMDHGLGDRDIWTIIEPLRS